MSFIIVGAVSRLALLTVDYGKVIAVVAHGSRDNFTTLQWY